MSIKKIICFVLAVLLLLPFASCSKTVEDDGRLSVVTTNFALYDFARAVCGEEYNVQMLISPGSESHDFEATLSDMAIVEKADLFVYIGGESEEWVNEMFDSMGKSADKIKKLCGMDLVEIYTEESLVGHDDHDHDDHGHGTEDEHIWTSIPNAITIMKKIADEVVSLDETLADTVYRNLEAYTAELTAVDTELREVINTAERKSIVVCDRFPFRYMTEEYGLDYCAAFSGCSSDTEPTLAMINSLVEKVNANSIPAIFIIEFSDGATARAVSAETGAEILTLHSAHNVTREDFDSGITYADIMRRNIEALTDALN